MNQASLTYLNAQNQPQTCLWLNMASHKPPKSATLCASISAKQALNLMRQQQALIWDNDFHQAQQLLSAIKKRLPPFKKDDFHTHRMQQAQQSQTLCQLLIPIQKGYQIALPRAPKQSAAALEAALGLAYQEQDFFLPLQQLRGILSAYEWQQQGIAITALDGQKIHLPYGVFSPLRGEYLDLITTIPLSPHLQTAIDVGTGSGILALILAKRGLPHIIATDLSAQALAAAQSNHARLLPQAKIDFIEADLFPEDAQADLIICNPPWLPAKPTSAIEAALYDPQSAMLKNFLRRAPAHLKPQGEIWLIMSNLAEALGLRQEGELAQWIAEAGLNIVHQSHTRPQHRKSQDAANPLAHARSQEITSLYVLQPQEMLK